MSVLDQIAFNLGRRDEVPNQELARRLSRRPNAPGIQEIVENLANRNQGIRSDCLKVLYELAYLKPELVAPHARALVDLLEDRNNRMVWGATIGLATIAALNPQPVWKARHRVMEAMAKGTLITRVWGVRALARATAGKPSRTKEILPALRDLLGTCSPRDVPTHLESMLPALTRSTWASIEPLVIARKKEMTRSHLARLSRVVRMAAAAAT